MKHISSLVLCLALLFFGRVSWSQGVVSNDECVDAQVLQVYDSISFEVFSLKGATGDPFGKACGGWPNDDVWFMFVAKSQNQLVVFQNFGDLFGVVGIYQSCLAEEALACESSFEAYQRFSVWYDQFEVGESYFIRVHEVSTLHVENSSFGIGVVDFPTPINNKCADAIPIEVAENPQRLIQKHLGATAQFDSVCGDVCERDLWYSFIAKDTIARVDIDGNVKSSVELIASCNSVSLDCWKRDFGNRFHMKGLEVDSLYYLRIAIQDNKSSENGLFKLSLTDSVKVTDNDDCSNAKIITQTNKQHFFQYDFRGYSLSSPLCSGDTTGMDAWFQFVATDDTVRLSCGGKDFFTSNIAIYNDCGDDPIICQNGIEGKIELVVTGLMEGSLYMIRVFNNSQVLGIESSFEMSVSKPLNVPDNDECVHAQEITPYEYCAMTEFNLLGATPSLPACKGEQPNDLWFKFKSESKNVLLSTFANAGGVVEVFRGCDNPLPLACENIFFQEEVEVNNLEIGEYYYLRYYDHSYRIRGNGLRDLCVQSLPDSLPWDECEGALLMEVLPICDMNFKFINTATESENSACQSDPNFDVWLKFTAPADSVFIFASESTGWWDMVLELKQGCDDEPIYCTDNFSTSFEDIKATGLVVGMDYYLRAYSYDEFEVGTSGLFFCATADIAIADGLNDITGHNLKVIPNPAHDVVKLEIPHEFKPTELIVRNLMGRVFFYDSHVSSSQSLDVSFLNPGIYFVQLNGDNNKLSTKLMIY